MALRTIEQWELFLQGLAIEEEASKTYSKKFIDNMITEHSLPALTREDLRGIGVTVIGHVTAILAAGKASGSATLSSVSATLALDQVNSQRNKPPPLTLPNLHLNMTSVQLRKFHVDWANFKADSGTLITEGQKTRQLYRCGDEDVQSRLVNIPEFFNMSEEQALATVVKLVSRKEHPIVHRLRFTTVSQAEGQSISDFLHNLNTKAKDCEYVCPNEGCKHNLSEMNVHDQFIRGLNNEALQQDILTSINAGKLSSLDNIVGYAKAFEAATQDQASLHKSPGLFAFKQGTRTTDDEEEKAVVKGQTQICRIR